MEGKTVILSVVILSLVMAQIQVEAKLCCPNELSRRTYYACISHGSSTSCARISKCIIINGDNCPAGYNNDILENSVQGNSANEYCKVGCFSSLCNALTTLQNSDASEIMNGAVDQCAKACSTVCAKGFTKTVETA